MCVGQPLFTDDAWWHLTLGAAYASEGPWLGADPLLHTAAGPPAPAAWLFDVALHSALGLVGFQGLRVTHVLLVACILGLAWTLLRRASGSARLASLGLALFSVLSAYRLFQLRPHLLTILVTLLLLRLLILPRAAPPWRSVAAAAGLFALWANLHGGFVLGLVLLGAAVSAQAILAIPSPEQRPRAARLATALGLALLATLANPSGADPHLLYFAAGSETPALAVVADEWAPVDLLRTPIPNLPPDALAWATVWALLLASPPAGLILLRRRRSEAPLVAVAAVALVALLSAVRLLWLGILPLLLLGRCLSATEASSRLRGVVAAAALLLVPAFLFWGAFPTISRGVHRTTYGDPFALAKHDAHAVWFLSDAELRGNLFNDYASGNFLGYWLAPRLRVFVNGSLNFPKPVMDARGAILTRSGDVGASFLELLDRYRVDIFLGTGMPVVSRPGRPETPTTRHLEGAPGWLPVFRSPRSAVYLRANARNRENLERVVAYYRGKLVPFDPERGFEPGRVIQAAPRWALEHGLVPVGFRNLEAAASSPGSGRGRAVGRLAELYAVLGLNEPAAALDRWLLRTDPGSILSRRRRVWSLVQLGQVEEALEAADRLEALRAEEDWLSGLLVSEARRRATLPDEEGAAQAARLPLLTRLQRQRILGSLLSAEARSPRYP